MTVWLNMLLLSKKTEKKTACASSPKQNTRYIYNSTQRCFGMISLFFSGRHPEAFIATKKWSGRVHVFAWHFLFPSFESSTESTWKFGLTLPETNSERPWKWMVGILLSYWGGNFSGAMLVSGRVIFYAPTFFVQNKANSQAIEL